MKIQKDDTCSIGGAILRWYSYLDCLTTRSRDEKGKDDEQEDSFGLHSRCGVQG